MNKRQFSKQESHMKLFLQSIVLTIGLFAGMANSHPSHDEPQTIDRQQAVTMATYFMQRQVKTGKLGESWESTEAADSTFGRRDSRMGWIVSFNNPEQTDKDKQTFFVFMTSTGYLLSSGFKLE